jgi:hypothetical protein
VHAGAQIVDPELLGPRGLVGGFLVEEQYVRLHALGVEQAGGQGVNVALVQELAADGFAGAAFEQDVVGYDHGGAAVLPEQGFDVLDKVELFVRGSGPEVTALDDVALFATTPQAFPDRL